MVCIICSVDKYNWMLFLSSGCPGIVRADCGTENTTLAATHMALRHEHSDDFSEPEVFDLDHPLLTRRSYNVMHLLHFYQLLED